MADEKTYSPFVMSMESDGIRTLIKSGCSAIYIMSNDPDKVSKEIDKFFLEDGMNGSAGPGTRTYGYFEWDNGQFGYASDINEQRRKSSMEIKTITLEKSEKTLPETMKFFAKTVPESLNFFVDGHVVKIPNAKAFFQHKDACKSLHQIIRHNDDENNMVRKTFILIGSEPYIPAELNEDFTFMRQDYGIVDKPTDEEQCDVPVIVEQTANFFSRILSIDLNEKAPWLAEEIKGLTKRDAEDILFYLAVGDKSIDHEKLRQYKKDLAHQDELFKYIG